MNAGIRMGRRLMILTLLFLMKSSLALAVTPGTEKWSFPTGSRYTRSAAIGLDRTIYTTTVNGRLHAITPDGTKKWEFQTEEDTMTSPAIGADGTVYLGTGNGKLYAINPDGTLKWLFETDGIIRATHVNSPAIGSDGTIYIGSYRDFEGKLYAINPDGTLKWQFQAYAGTNAHEYSPVVGADGTIYASALHSLYAVNPDGTLKWEFLARLLIRGSPAIGADGTIYVLSQSGSPAQTSLYAINPDGTVKWEFQLRDSANGSPVIGPDGTIYFGTFWEGKIHAINPDGTKKWELKPGGDQSTFMAPAVGADGAIYFGNLHGGFYAINPEGTLRWRSYSVSCTSSLTIGPDGTIYLGRDYRLLAIYSDSYGLAESPWPMWQYDIRHTGRIETGTAIIPLMPDEPYQGLIKPWPPDYFSLTVEEGRSLLIEVLPQAGVDALMLDGKLGALPPYPGMGEYTTREENSRGRYELLISPTEGGTYYFSLLGSKVDLAGGLYTITARFADQYLSDVMPRSAGNAGMIVLSVKGLGFTEGLDIQLSGEGPSFLAPEEMLFVSSAEVLARFDLSGAEPGIYHVTVTWAGGEQDSLSEAFEIMEGGSAQLEARLDPPDAVRPGRTYTVWLEYENTGNVDMLAPLFTVTGNCPISLDEERITLERVGILGIGGSAMPEVLRIGESRRVPIYFIAPSDVDRAEFTLFITEDSDEPIDWAAQKDLMKAPDMTQEEWDALWPELIRRLGDTWGEYLEVLRNNARRLKGRGIDGYDVRTLIRLEARQAAGLPVASVSGTLRDRGTGAALKGVPIKVTNEDGTILKQVETAFNPEGHFCVEDLPDGTYEIRPEGYYFEIPVTVTISGGQDVNGLVLFAREVPPPEVPGEEMGIPDHRPAMAGDGTGRLYLVWEHAKEIWWAIGEGGEWAQSGPIPDAEGSDPVVVYDEGLLDGGASEGLFCAWESATRPKTIVWSAGRPEGGGITWSTPQALTWDSYDDYGVAVITDTDHNPLILWLQRDAGIEDDADLYYQGLDLSGVSYYWVEPPEGVVTQIPIELCLSMGFAKGESLPKWIPIIGGKYGFEVNGEICGDLDCGPSLSGNVGLGVEFGKYVSGSGEVGGEAGWHTDAERCVYIFDEGSVSLGIGVSVEILSQPIPIVIFAVPIGYARLWGVIEGSANGTLFWRSNFPAWPDEADVLMNAGGGPKGVVELFGGGLGGEATGKASVEAEYTTPPSTWEFKGYCITLQGKVKAIWGMFEQTWKKSWGTSCPEAGIWLVPLTVRSSRDSLLMRGSRIMVGDVPVYEEVGYVKDPLVGTGSVYEGNPVLGDISLDLFNDGLPALARGASGEIILVWARDHAASDLGATVYAATYDGANWGAPIAITPDVDFNKDAAVVFDSGGVPMAVWSSASNEGLDYEGSSVEEILGAMENADLMYSRRVGAEWISPQVLADLEGRDEQVSLSSGPGGEITAAWLNATESSLTVYGSIWDGSSWSSPEVISSAAGADAPSVTHTSEGPIVLWAQDTDGNADTFDDWRLYFSAWDGSSWSPPAPIQIGGTGPGPQELNGLSRRPLSRPLGSLFTPPQECCEEEEEDEDPLPPDPPKDPIGGGGSDVVFSVDPNEKAVTSGEGDLHYVDAGDRLTYTVYFENEPDATAPAQEAFIIDCLDPHLDWMTARVEEISFGDVTLINPHETPVFYERVTIPDYREEEDKQWWVDVRTEFDVEFGCLKLTMRTLDPETGQLPEDPFAGFLPPEDGTGRGQGHISFSALTERDVPNDTVVKNEAAIKFDTNDPILTNEVFNTVLNLYIKRLRPRLCEPGEVIRIIGHNFGATQGESLVHISKKVFDSASPRIVLWSDTKIKIRVPKYKCKWFKGKELRRRKVWVTVNGMDSNTKRLKVMKPATCE